MKRLYFLLLLCLSSAWAETPDSPYLQHAQEGDSRAQFYLADTLFSAGEYQQAESWAAKSAAQGDADAMALLAQLKIHDPANGDYQQAKSLAEQAVAHGSKPGSVVLARILVNTQAGKPDYSKAMQLLESASQDIESDSAVDAQMFYGMLYANGVGVVQDDDKAAFWFKRSSALSRTGYAEYWAGMLFLNGEKGFIATNKQKALHWLNVSCTEGFDTGCEEFEEISNGG
ncbi:MULTISPECIES: tetratricopeptide repeat protein [Buttiauxella]|jgi:TPR repeat protein|uniref:Exported protein n=1 Tax=Buttiauxella ferragutiae ATCC 51602 TaxID=1354252 RepID=A0ABX2W4D4_9ENTR|nr:MULTISPECIES: tetratricopeptide repeat protein [Buttiauxella]AYN29956.1 sel1 repeat family protein [Buttiauxella sp. 3AFRM03]MCE0827261.1 sel1 repeat family protein [Buttiauxella ferragutiae]OAT25545.1 putative exported protein [Buttiauxella ferragutiae ATCC 51602]UNK59662.1 sel1 repeat family protein [Buttiauxella ferragutiae]